MSATFHRYKAAIILVNFRHAYFDYLKNPSEFNFTLFINYYHCADTISSLGILSSSASHRVHSMYSYVFDFSIQQFRL